MLWLMLASSNVLVGGNGAYMYYSTQDGDPIEMYWVDISATGTAVGAGDDWCSWTYASTAYQLGFGFPYYGNTVDSISICSNGVIALTNHGTTISLSNTALPNTSYGGFVAPMWDDLNPAATGADDIYFQSFTTCPDGYSGACAVIQYHNVPRYGDTTLMDFEVILYDNGDIKFQYNSSVYYNDATVGIQDSGGVDYTQYIYNGDPVNHIPDSGTVILFKKLDYPYHEISDIQGTVIPGTDTSAYYGNVVYTSGIIVSKGAKTAKGFHIKMPAGGPYSGIMVYVNDTTGGYGDLQIGDKVILRGSITEYWGYTEVVVDSMSHITLVSSGNSYAIDTVTASMISNDNPDSAEMYEGVLIRLNSAVVDSEGTYYYYISDPTGTALLSKDNISPLMVGSVINVTGIVLYSYGEYKILARSDADIEIVEYPVVTIDTIQRTMDSTYSSVFAGSYVNTIGVVSSIFEDLSALFLAENPYGPYKGILVILPAIPSFISEGDSVQVFGFVDEVGSGNTAIEVADSIDIVVLGTGTIPSPILIPAGYLDTSSTSTYYPVQPDTAEAYEHVLVKVETLQIAEYMPDTFGNYLMIRALKGADNVYFYVDTVWTMPAVGDYYNVTGYVVGGAYGLYALLPRDATDLEQVTGYVEGFTGNFIRLAGLSRDGIRIRYSLDRSEDVPVKVYSINGRLLVNRSIRLNAGQGEVVVPAILRSGVYIVNIGDTKLKTIVR